MFNKGRFRFLIFIQLLKNFHYLVTSNWFSKASNSTMKIEQFVYTGEASVKPFTITPQLIFAFGHRELLESQTLTQELAKSYPNAILTGCSTAGEIISESVRDGTIIFTAIEFADVKIQSAKVGLKDSDFNSFEIGKKLVSQFPQEGLKHVFVVSDGLKVNGTDLGKRHR